MCPGQAYNRVDDERSVYVECPCYGMIFSFTCFFINILNLCEKQCCYFKFFSQQSILHAKKDE